VHTGLDPSIDNTHVIKSFDLIDESGSQIKFNLNHVADIQRGGTTNVTFSDGYSLLERTLNEASAAQTTADIQACLTRAKELAVARSTRYDSVQATMLYSGGINPALTDQTSLNPAAPTATKATYQQFAGQQPLTLKLSYGGKSIVGAISELQPLVYNQPVAPS
jgi:hypothetical protein